MLWLSKEIKCCRFNCATISFTMDWLTTLEPTSSCLFGYILRQNWSVIQGTVFKNAWKSRNRRFERKMSRNREIVDVDDFYFFRILKTHGASIDKTIWTQSVSKKHKHPGYKHLKSFTKFFKNIFLHMKCALSKIYSVHTHVTQIASN